MLRASYLSMKKLALDILKNSRSFESEKQISKISDLLKYSKEIYTKKILKIFIEKRYKVYFWST